MNVLRKPLEVTLGLTFQNESETSSRTKHGLKVKNAKEADGSRKHSVAGCPRDEQVDKFVGTARPQLADIRRLRRSRRVRGLSAGHRSEGGVAADNDLCARQARLDLLPVRNDIAGTLGRMQPRCQQHTKYLWRLTRCSARARRGRRPRPPCTRRDSPPALPRINESPFAQQSIQSSQPECQKARTHAFQS